MKFFTVRVGALVYRDLQLCSCDAIIAAMNRFPAATGISAKLEK